MKKGMLIYGLSLILTGNILAEESAPVAEETVPLGTTQVSKKEYSSLVEILAKAKIRPNTYVTTKNQEEKWFVVAHYTLRCDCSGEEEQINAKRYIGTIENGHFRDLDFWSMGDDKIHYKRRGILLDIDGLGLRSLPASIGNFTNVKFLNLGWNSLTTLPPEIGKLSRLEGLYIYHNQLGSLPSEIGKLKSLRRAEFMDNKLTSLPQEIGNCTALQWLDVSDNKLTAVPLGNMQLHHLNLKRNDFSLLPPEIGNQPLEWLYVSQNKLTSLPSELKKCPLRVIDISQNPLNQDDELIKQLKERGVVVWQ